MARTEDGPASVSRPGEETAESSAPQTETKPEVTAPAEEAAPEKPAKAKASAPKPRRAGDPELEKLIADKSVEQLLEMHREMTITAADLGVEVEPAKTFVDADAGRKVVRALHARIQKLRAAKDREDKQKEKEAMAKTTKKRTNANSRKAVKGKTKAAGKRRTFADDQKISLTAAGKKGNPFRENSTKAKLHAVVIAADGQTVKTFRAKGGKDKGLSRAVRRKLATVA